MSIEEVIGWIAYDQIEPMENSWQQHGDMCALIAQLAGNKNLKSEDFIPKVKEKKSDVVQSDEEIKNVFGGLIANMQRKTKS